MSNKIFLIVDDIIIRKGCIQSVILNRKKQNIDIRYIGVSDHHTTLNFNSETDAEMKYEEIMEELEMVVPPLDPISEFEQNAGFRPFGFRGKKNLEY